MKHIKDIASRSFMQLLAVYTTLVAIVSAGAISAYTLHFEIFALILAVLGLFALTMPEKQDVRYASVIALVALIVLVVIRVIPYVTGTISLGYDAGLYKYGIEHGLENKDKWILAGGMEPGFLYLMKSFSFFPSSFVLKYLFIFFIAILGFALYLCAKEYFGKKAAIISLLFYSLSAIQFSVFTYMYYKNIIALALMLFAFTMLKKPELKHKIAFVLLGIAIGAIHRPTFYIFGLSYLIFAFISPKEKTHYNLITLRNNVLNGLVIFVGALLFYLGDFMPAITSMISPVLGAFTQPGESPGTFISFTQYQFSTLAYLPLALLGLFLCIKGKRWNVLTIWAIINAAIVYFQFYFFNRFIIHLDIIALILVGAAGASLDNKYPRYGKAIILILLISTALVTIPQAYHAKAPISENALDLIKQLDQTEPDAYVMSISSRYSPWIIGYSERRTIAPGLFDHDKWSRTEWAEFWSNPSKERTIELMSRYDGKIYLFAGSSNYDNICFELYKENGGDKVYKYVC